MLSREEIANRFGAHKASIGSSPSAHDHAYLRGIFLRVGEILNEALPEGREKDIALKELEDTSMWAHKALAYVNPLDEDGIKRVDIEKQAESPEFHNGKNEGRIGCIEYKDDFTKEIRVSHDRFFCDGTTCSLATKTHIPLKDRLTPESISGEAGIESES